MEYSNIQENFQSIPNAKSCRGWNCSIEGQYCPPGVPGSSRGGYTCCNKKWRSGKRNCMPKPQPKPQKNVRINSKYVLHSSRNLSCPKGTLPVPKEKCLEAVKAVLPIGRNIGRKNLVVGNWGWVPKGCTTQTGGDWAAHFNTGNGANLSSLDKRANYRKLCYVKPCPKQYSLKGHKKSSIDNLKDWITKSRKVFDGLSTQYRDRIKMISTQNDLLNKQKSMIDLRNNMVVKRKNSLADKKDNIHTNKRKLMYESVYDRRSIIITRILKTILLILAITLIVILSKNKTLLK